MTRVAPRKDEQRYHSIYYSDEEINRDFLSMFVYSSYYSQSSIVL